MTSRVHKVYLRYMRSPTLEQAWPPGYMEECGADLLFCVGHLVRLLRDGHVPGSRVTVDRWDRS